MKHGPTRHSRITPHPLLSYFDEQEPSRSRWSSIRSWVRRYRKVLFIAGGLIIVGIGVRYIYEKIYLESDTNYTFGVLSLNTDTFLYTPGQPVLIQISTLDKSGHTICDSDLKLSISVPGEWKPTILTTKEGQIIPTHSCKANNVTNEPDYIVRFMPKKTGEYRIRLVNTKTGKRTTTTFEVIQETIPVRVERTAPSRINPFKTDRYPMGITLTARSDFSGTYVETVPLEFIFVWQGAATVERLKDSQKISWNISLKAGESKRLAYEFTVPKESPKFYKINAMSTSENEHSISGAVSGVWNLTVTQP